MTISNPSNRVVFVGPGNGFAYDRPVFAATDIFVEILTTAGDKITPVLDGPGTFDFTVTGTFDDDQFRFPNGVTVTLNTALPAGDIITIENRVALTQLTDYVNGGPLNAERLETDFDRLVVMAQAPASILSDVVRISPASGFALPPLIPAASEFLRWNSLGNAIESADITPTGSLGVPVAIQDGGTGAETAADARSNLSVPGLDDNNTLTGDNTFSGENTFSGNIVSEQVVPTGAMLDYAAAGIAPDGFLLCDGSNVSRTTYADLFAVLGTTWGPGDGSTTFGLPDTRRKVSVGSGGTGTATLGNAVGDTGGEEDHALTEAEMPGHDHQTVQGPTNFGRASAAISGGASTIWSADVDESVTTGNAGSSSAHNNMQPGYVVQKIVKT